MLESVGSINPLFSLFHQEKKEIREAVTSEGNRSALNWMRPKSACSRLAKIVIERVFSEPDDPSHSKLGIGRHGDDGADDNMLLPEHRQLHLPFLVFDRLE
jgi:hypothetical protein